MRLAVLACVAVVGCADPPVTGEASSTAVSTIASAFVQIRNVDLVDPPGIYRRWEVGIFEDPPGTTCTLVGEPLVVIYIYTIFNSGPRGEMVLQNDGAPPILFPTAYATLTGNYPVQGTLTIGTASTTKLVGEITGFANLEGTLMGFDLVFDAPTCE